MANVVFGMAMSLDGFVADRNGSVARLYPDFEAISQSERMQETLRTTGAVVMGRRTYDMGQGDYTGYEFQVPIFVVTHHPPETAAKGENDRLKFHFITDGVESAVRQAKAAAGERNVVVVGGPTIAQQLISANLIDELDIDVIPVLLGGGLRLFEHFDGEAVTLDTISISPMPTGANLRYRVTR